MSMMTQIYELVKTFLTLAEDQRRTREEVKEIRRDLLTLALVLQSGKYLPSQIKKEQEGKITADYRLQRLERYFRDPTVGDNVLRPDLLISKKVCRNIRTALNLLGYKVINGDDYDSELQATVRSFQSDNNLTPDGFFGLETRRLLTEKLKDKLGDQAFNSMEYPEGEVFPRIFLSYAHEDVASARRLFDDLRGVGLNVWFDNESLLPGQKWKVAIEWAISNSRFFLALLSENSVNKTGYVQKEVKSALEVLDEYPDQAIFIIPVRLDTCNTLDSKLRDLHWVDMFPRWEVGLERILKSIAL